MSIAAEDERAEAKSKKKDAASGFGGISLRFFFFPCLLSFCGDLLFTVVVPRLSFDLTWHEDHQS